MASADNMNISNVVCIFCRHKNTYLLFGSKLSFRQIMETLYRMFHFCTVYYCVLYACVGL